MSEVWRDEFEVQRPPIGSVVRVRTQTAQRGYLEPVTVTGTVVAWGGGVEPHFRLHTGRCIHPTLGDTWELV